MADVLSLENPVFAQFVFYSTILALKCLLMSFLTSRHRLSNKVFGSTEDYVYFDKKTDRPAHATGHQDVERVRNAHRNDMENIFPFFTIGLLFVLCKPDLVLATWLFRIFTGARICHTIVYLNGLRQPFRGMTFFIGMVINITICFLILKATFAA